MKFTELDLDEQLLEAIGYMGFKEASPIQEKAIPEILNGKDIIACAQTGTGKTAAFLLPVLNDLVKKERSHTSTLVVVPTRELAIQIDQQIEAIAYFSGIQSIAIYGGGDGSSWDVQKEALTGGTDIIVATPGKLLSHLNMGYVAFDKIEYLIFDEADRMLDQGFHADLMRIISYLPEKRQNLLFSATFPPKIRDLAKKILVDPVEVSISISKPAEGVIQAAYLTHDNQKTPIVQSLINDKPNYESIIIFSSTKKKVSGIVRSLRGNGYNVQGVSSDFDQKEREEALLKFKTKETRVIVATDVLSRGIDIKDINLVINYDVPNDPEDYVHRIGRTARANTTGVAITFINEDDMFNFGRIESLIEKEIIKIYPPEELGEGPEWKLPSRKPKKKGGGKRKFYKKKS